MTFEEAEKRFRELQARVQRGEAISRAEYEDQVSRLAVQDQFGVLWEINPRTGKWMYFDGAEWVSGAPPGRETSTVIPLSSLTPKPTGQTTQPNVPAAPPSSMPTSAPRSPARPPTPTAAAKTAPTALTRQQPPPSSVPQRMARTAPARPAGQPPAQGQAPRGGRSPLSMFAGREWIPLAIAAGVLLVCALLLGGAAIVVNSGVFGNPAAATTPTRTATRPGLAGGATVTPTRVALPTQPPPTNTPTPVIAKVTPATLNVRAAPDTKTGKVISTLKKDAQITLIARSVDALWYQINLANGQQGWISAELVTIASGDPNTLPQAGPGAPTAPPAPKPGVATPAPKAYP